MESYLRLNGYLTITEVDIPHLALGGRESIADVDVLAVRFPGDLYTVDVGEEADTCFPF